jgi:hypothetical protein
VSYPMTLVKELLLLQCEVFPRGGWPVEENSSSGDGKDSIRYHRP